MLIAAGVGALALTSPGLSQLLPAIEEAAAGRLAIVAAGDVAAARAERTLRHAGLLARRTRQGRLITLSSDPRPRRRRDQRECRGGSYGSESRVSNGHSSRSPVRRRTSPRRRSARGASRA